MNEKRHMFDDEKNVRRVLKVLVVVCILTAGADFIYHRHVVQIGRAHV